MTSRDEQGGVERLSLYAELRRRNVFKVAIVYVAVAWLLLQIADTLGPALYLPDWVISAVAFLLILGFPVALILAWAFELTPEGIKPDSQAHPNAPGSGASKLSPLVITALGLAVAYFAFDKFVLSTDRETAESMQRPAAEAAGPASGTTGNTAANTTANTAPSPMNGTPPTPPEPATPDNSIAVLPFINMSSDPEQEYFSDGLADELLNLLSRIPEMQVAARSSSFSFKGQNLEVTEIADRLNVAHVLEGSVRKQGDQLRITAQLVQADNGFQLWSETYDRRLDNVFQIQEDIAGAVVDALRINLLGEAPTVRTADPAAYQLFLEGQYLKRQISTDSLHRAVEAFEQSVAIDPSYAPAWAEMADTYMWIGGSEQYSRAMITERSNEAVQAAIRNDPDYAFAYYVRGIHDFFRTMRFREGLEDFQRAYDLEPDNPVLVAAIGKGALLAGDFERAIAQYHEALAMDPVFPEFHWFLGKAYMSDNRFDEAEATFRKLIDLSPDSYGNGDLWETLFLQGELEEALARSDSSFGRAVTQYALGNREASDEALAELIDSGAKYHVALVFGYRGDADKTFEWLERVMQDPDRAPTFILTENAFHAVHDDERWPQLLARLDLTEYWQAMARAD
jgi:TolB-like protein/Tfp pilus assembly protein PilF